MGRLEEDAKRITYLKKQRDNKACRSCAYSRYQPDEEPCSSCKPTEYTKAKMTFIARPGEIYPFGFSGWFSVNVEAEITIEEG